MLAKKSSPKQLLVRMKVSSKQLNSLVFIGIPWSGVLDVSGVVRELGIVETRRPATSLVGQWRYGKGQDIRNAIGFVA